MYRNKRYTNRRYDRKDQRSNSNGYKRRDYMDNSIPPLNSNPTSEGSVKDGLSRKSLRDLVNSTYSFKASPTEAANATATSYSILSAFNPTIDAKYLGSQNLDGGNVQQYANSSTSNFLKIFDYVRLKMAVNYRYLPIKPNEKKVGYSLIDEMRKSISEAVSVLKSTTFTTMAINQFAVKTDLPMGSAVTTNINTVEQPIEAYTSLTDVLYALSVYYQIFFQDALSVMNWHNSFRFKQGTMIRNSFNRETPSLNSLFGLFNKTSWINMLNSINLSFEGEFIDTKFMEQMNCLCLTPSRRSDAMTDPLLELQIEWNHPSVFEIYILDENGKAVKTTPFYSDELLKVTIPVGAEVKAVDFWTACNEIRNYLSAEATMNWARKSWTPAVIEGSDTARFNQVKAYFDVIIGSMTIFKPKFSDYREALDVMTRTGVLTWVKGFRPSVVKENDCKVFQNLLVDDIYNFVLSGPDEIEYDDATKRWRTFSKWNMYKGIPSYDTVSGGSFLSFSFKSNYLDPSGNNSEQIDYLPVLFSYDPQVPPCFAVSRDGHEVAITYDVITMSGNPVLNRLVPLQSQRFLKIRVPWVKKSKDLDIGHYSNLYKMLNQIFGLCEISTVSDNQTDFSLDSDILAIYQIEVEDVTNMAISYARSFAPFKGTTSELNLIGFDIK